MEESRDEEGGGGVSSLDLEAGGGVAREGRNCSCEDYHLLWPEDSLCYREFSRGPCPTGHRYSCTGSR